MSLNTAHANNGVLIHSGEYILLFSDKITIEFIGQDSPVFKGSKDGRIYLTSHRMIFNAKNQSESMQSFSFPFVTLNDVELEQPVFGANYIKGKCRSQPNGNWTGEVKFKLYFKGGGAIDFGQALRRAAKTAQSNMHNDAPPPYTPPSGPWHEAPLPAYQPPPGYYGWLPNNENFNQGPPPNSVFMSDNPPPYPGLATPGQGQAQGFAGGFVQPQQGYPGAPPPYGGAPQGGYPGYPNGPQPGYPGYPNQSGYPGYSGPQPGYNGYPGQQPGYPSPYAQPGGPYNPNAGGYQGPQNRSGPENINPNIPSTNPVYPSVPSAPSYPSYPGASNNSAYNPNQTNPNANQNYVGIPTGGYSAPNSNATSKEAEAALSAQSYNQNNAGYNTYSGGAPPPYSNFSNTSGSPTQQNQNLGAYSGQNANSSGEYAAPPCMNGPPPNFK
ncbi:postacrosomal sheath WW domain-binding protein isoform X1 [Condylostylus longicornis]|uniref:postacrosomal sheath WW domain-binding protein isoform X1 n=1 Tax=Condylostylus longicornis TaxID=2530218 RepID=UPI00244DBEF7|nr:postacrosomal sheath WW domain-binding protein isoform X1 [Condylostylus longicornis]